MATWTFSGFDAASPDNLNLGVASHPYLQGLTAYFFPTATTQIANVLGQRSSQGPLSSSGNLLHIVLVTLNISTTLAPSPTPASRFFPAFRRQTRHCK